MRPVPSRAPAPKPSTVVVVDDHAIVREGLVLIVGREPDFTVVGEAADEAGLIEVARREQPELAIVDLHIPGVDPPAMLRALGEVAPDCAIVVLTMDADPHVANRAILAGAVGYVLKDSPPATMLAALRRARDGHSFLEPEVGEKLARLGGADPVASLTDRERDVLVAVARGLTNREIAEELAIGVRTVETHRARLRAKLGISGVAQLASFARRHGLVFD